MSAIIVDASGVATVTRSASEPALVLALGDSLYAGHGLASADSLPAQIERRLQLRDLPASIVNRGISGDTTAGGRKRFRAALDALPRVPDLVMLGLGANDALRGVAPAETRANLAAMLDLCRERGLPVLLTGMIVPEFLVPGFARAFNAIWPELARDYGAALDPFIMAGLVGRSELMLRDRIHPNAKGVAVMADRLTPLVARLLTEGRTTAG